MFWFRVLQNQGFFCGFFKCPETVELLLRISSTRDILVTVLLQWFQVAAGPQRSKLGRRCEVHSRKSSVLNTSHPELRSTAVSGESRILCWNICPLQVLRVRLCKWTHKKQLLFRGNPHKCPASSTYYNEVQSRGLYVEKEGGEKTQVMSPEVHEPVLAVLDMTQPVGYQFSEKLDAQLK